MTDQGYLASPREIRTWREHRWVVPAITEAQGYARGSQSTNPPEAFAQALAVAKVRAGKRTSPHEIAFRLFARGYPISGEALHEAWQLYFDDLRKAIAKYVTPGSDAFDAGEQLAISFVKVANRSKAGRYMLRHAKKLGESPRAVVESALTVVLTGMLGGSVKELAEPPSVDECSAMDEMQRVTGMDGFVNDRVEGVGSIVASHEELRSDNVRIFEYFTLDVIEEAGQTMNLDRLVRGREQALVLLRFMTSFARSTALTSGPATAFGLSFIAALDTDDTAVAVLSLLVAILNEWMPGRMEELLPMWTVEADRHSALVLGLEAAPKHLRKYLSVRGPPIEQVPEDLREELIAFTEGFKHHHPELAEAIGRPSVPPPELTT